MWAISRDRLVEGGLVGLRGLGRAADLADVLQRGGGHLVIGRGRLEVVERADVAAHASSVRRGHRAVASGRRKHRSRSVARSPAPPGRRAAAPAGRRDVVAVLDLHPPLRQPAARRPAAPTPSRPRPCQPRGRPPSAPSRRSGSQVNWRGSVPAPAAAAGPVADDVEPPRVGEVGDVEQRRLGAPAAPRRSGVLPSPISRSSPRSGAGTRRSPGIFSSPSSRGCRRVGEVDGVERVDLPEGHHDRQVVEPAHRLDLLADAELVDPADLDAVVAVLAQRDHRVEVCRSHARADRDPQHAVGSSIDQRSATEPVDLAGGDVRRAGAGRARRRGSGSGRRRPRARAAPVHPAASACTATRQQPHAERVAGGEVEPVGGGVDEPGVGGHAERGQVAAGRRRRSRPRPRAERRPVAAGPSRRSQSSSCSTPVSVPSASSS